MKVAEEMKPVTIKNVVNGVLLHTERSLCLDTLIECVFVHQRCEI